MFAARTDMPAGIFSPPAPASAAARACSCGRRRHRPARYLLLPFFVLACAGPAFVWTHPDVDMYLGVALMLLTCALLAGALVFGAGFARAARRRDSRNVRAQAQNSSIPDAPADPATSVAADALGAPGAPGTLPAPGGHHDGLAAPPPRFAQLRTRRCSLPCDSATPFSVACFETDCNAAACVAASCARALNARAHPATAQSAQTARSSRNTSNTANDGETNDRDPPLYDPAPRE